MNVIKSREEIESISLDCPLCDKKHDVKRVKRVATIEIKGVEVEYDEVCFVCGNSPEGENEFIDAKTMDVNLLNARNAYRIMKGLLTSYEIVAIRKKYGLSQVELAKLLGWGEATISRYESKAIQDEAYDNILREIKENAFGAYEYLNKNKYKFTEERANEIKDKILTYLESDGKEYYKRRSLECDYVHFEEPSEYNGYQLLDINKIEGMVSRLASYSDKLYKMQLMRMLWYADRLAYKESGRAISGLVYRRDKMGAIPIGYNSVMELENILVKEEIDGENIKYKIEKNNNIDMSCISADEMNIIDRVVEIFKESNMDDILDNIQKEMSYINIEDGEIIAFKNEK